MVGDNDLCLHEFRFIPAKEPGVQAQLDESSSALKWFFELFDEEVQTDLVKLINEFATYTIQQNNPCRQDLNIQNGTLLHAMNSSNSLQHLLQWE